MARNRMIKPEFWTDSRLNSVSLESNLLFVALWNFADDFGVLIDSDRRILGDIFPLRIDVDIQSVNRWKQELLDAGLIIKIEIEGKKFLAVRNWEKHQKVPNPSKRRYTSYLDLKDALEFFEKNVGNGADYLDTNEGLIRVYFSKEERRKNKEQRERERYRGFAHLEISVKEKDQLVESGLTLKEIDEYCDKIENYKKNDKYKSLKLTILDWWKREKKSKDKCNREGY